MDGARSEVLAHQSEILGRSPARAFEERDRPVGPGTFFVWCSDGIIECTNKDGRAFGRGKRLRALEEHSKTGTVAHVRDAIVQDALKHPDGHPLEDDLTLLVGSIVLEA